MKIRHYLYNAFIIETGQSKLAIDPGQNLWLFKLRSLIPKSEWDNITHILVTHGDPDHYWQADRAARASNAFVICGRELSKVENGKTFLVAPRGRGLSAWTCFEKAYPIDVGDTLILNGVTIEGLKAIHGPIQMSLFGFKVKQHPGPGERVGLGAMGYKISIGNKVIVNLGDTLLQQAWAGLKPDVLMIPIGGLGDNVWTMDVTEALAAVKLIQPKSVIPCHYNASFLWKKNAAPADVFGFKDKVEAEGIACTIMKTGDEITL